mgnify:CR=1 FL=1|jgi:hypothetical protein
MTETLFKKYGVTFTQQGDYLLSCVSFFRDQIIRKLTF